MTGFTFIFPILGLITLPTALMVIYSIMTGDISFIDENPIPQVLFVMVGFLYDSQSLYKIGPGRMYF